MGAEKIGNCAANTDATQTQDVCSRRNLPNAIFYPLLQPAGLFSGVYNYSTVQLSDYLAHLGLICSKVGIQKRAYMVEDEQELVFTAYKNESCSDLFFS